MRHPGREFGSERPEVIYVALRWNDSNPQERSMERMVKKVAEGLKEQPAALRIYNLVRPSGGRGMSLAMDELGDVEQTIRCIEAQIDKCQSVRRIVVGGRSGPMPLIALLLKLLVPRIRIEICNHHRARAVHGGPVVPVQVLRP